MLHEVLTPLIKIDEIATANEALFAHFLTRPVKVPALLVPWAGTIYTSASIKAVLRRSWCRPHIRIVVLQQFARQCVTLSDGSELVVVLLPTESAELNVMLLLELGDQRAFYTGSFTEYQSVLRSSFCQIDRPRHSDHFIHVAHVDNTVSGNTPTIPQTCDAIRDIVARHPGHRIRIPLANVGYEDLLVALTRPPYSFKLTVGLLRMVLMRMHLLGTSSAHDNSALPNFTTDTLRAHIVAVVEQPTTSDEYAIYVRERIITVRLVPPLPSHRSHGTTASPRPPKYHAALGLYELTYTPHASAAQVLELVEHLRPGAVRGIYADAKREPDDADLSLPAGELNLQPYEKRNRTQLREIFGDDEDDDDDDDDDDDGGIENQIVGAPTKTQPSLGADVQSPVATSSAAKQRPADAVSTTSEANDTSWMNTTGDSLLDASSGDHSRLLRRRRPQHQRPSKLLTSKRQRIVYDDI